MANSNNVYGTAQPLQGSVSDWVTGQEKMDFAYRAEQRDVAKLAQDKRDKEKVRIDKWKSEIKIPEFDATGVRKTDQIQTELLLNLKGEINELTKKIYPGMPYEEEAKIRTELEMINNAPRLLKLGTESYTKEIQNIQNQLDEGKVVLTPNQMKMMDGFAQGRISLNWNGGQIVVGMFDQDGKVTDAMPLDKLINGETFGKLIPNVNVADKFRTIGKTMGTKTSQTDANYVKTKEKYTPKQLNEIAARNELFQQDGKFTPTAQKYLLDLGITDYDNVPEEVKDKMLLDAVDWMKSGQDTEKTVDVDYSAKNTAIKNAQDERIARAKDKKEEEDKSVTFRKVALVKGNGPNKENPSIKGIDGAEIFSMEGGNLERKIGDKGAYERVEKVYLLPDGETMVFDVDRVNGTQSTGETGEVKFKVSNTEKVSYTSKSQTPIIADFILKKINPNTGTYYKNVDEFRTQALGGKSKAKAKSQGNNKETQAPQFDADGNIIL